MIVTRQGSTAASPRTGCLPAAVRRRGTSLLNQQFWLWGQDIRRPAGNLLLRHGFERTRPPDGVQGSRCYTLRLDAHRTVVLWGFGIFYGDRAHGGLYLSRFGLVPLLLESGQPPVAVWTPTHLPQCALPADEDEWLRARPLLIAALRWISGYESWILKEMGSAYRHDCLAAWSHPVCTADASAALWLRLAQRCDATLQRAIRSVSDRAF